MKTRQLIPYEEFIALKRSIYGRQWTVQPTWFVSWLLSRLNIFESQASREKLPTANFVSLESVKVGLTAIRYGRGLMS